MKDDDGQEICPDQECGGFLHITWDEKEQCHKLYCGMCLEYERLLKDAKCDDCGKPADSPEYKMEVDEGGCSTMCKKCIGNYPYKEDEDSEFIRHDPRKTIPA